MHFYQFRKSLITGLFILTGYFSSSGQTIINLEPELPAPIATLAQQAGLKSWYDKTAKTWCCMYNDHKAVYIQLTIADLLQQKKIVENGIELWIDVKGKKKRNTSIAFPLPATPPANDHAAPSRAMKFPFPPPDNEEALDKTAIRQQLKALVSLQREMRLKGFVDELNGVQNAKHPSGLQVSLQFHHDTLVYLAAIPFQALSRPVSFTAPMTIGIVEAFYAEGNANAQQLWKDDMIWYRFTVKR